MKSPEEQLNPPIDMAEVVRAFELLYPDKFKAVVEVLGNSKRMALIPQEDPNDDRSSH